MKKRILFYLILRKDLTNKSFFVILMLGEDMNKELIERYMPLVLEIKDKYKYDDNICHLLYVIIPAFVYKYKYKENIIINVFKNTKIVISKEENKYVKAFYTSIPSYVGNDIVTNKFIIINNYKNISLVNLIDSLIHEFNHAVNSYNNEISIKDNTLYLRTGLTYVSYEIPSLKSLEKLPTYMLEEIINTKQTESIIDIIKNYKDTSNQFISNIVYSLNNETNNQYRSNAYYLETQILDKLLNNKTFMSTLENLRITGNISDIKDWFDNISGIKDSYDSMIKKLNLIMDLEIKLANAKYFRKRIIAKIRSLSKDIYYIIDTFNDNCNYR